MSISSTPSNQNLAQAAKFSLNFTRLADTTFFCTSANMPGLSIQEFPHTTPFIDMYAPGNKLTYETLRLSFLVDEDYRSWLGIHDWIRAMAFPENFDEYKALPSLRKDQGISPSIIREPQYSDAQMTIFTNKNNPAMIVKFKDCFPLNLTGISYNVENDADTIITGQAEFRFSYYEIYKL